MIILFLFFQKQILASAVYLFGLGTRPSGPGLKHMLSSPTKTLLVHWWFTYSLGELGGVLGLRLLTPLSVHLYKWPTLMSHSYSTIGHALMTVMTFTSPPSLPLSNLLSCMQYDRYVLFARKYQAHCDLTCVENDSTHSENRYFFFRTPRWGRDPDSIQITQLYLVIINSSRVFRCTGVRPHAWPRVHDTPPLSLNFFFVSQNQIF